MRPKSLENASQATVQFSPAPDRVSRCSSEKSMDSRLASLVKDVREMSRQDFSAVFRPAVTRTVPSGYVSGRLRVTCILIRGYRLVEAIQP